MWRSKKSIVIALLATLVLGGSTAGIVLAQDNGDDSQPKTLLARVAEKLEMNQQELEDAFAEARGEMRSEAMQNHLQNLIDQGKITQDEADQYKEWWQARPDTPLPTPFGRFGSHGFRGSMMWGGGHPFWGK